jgi:hypothetical protein
MVESDSRDLANADTHRDPLNSNPFRDSMIEAGHEQTKRGTHDSCNSEKLTSMPKVIRNGQNTHGTDE